MFREVLSLPSGLCHPSDPRTQDPYFPFLPFALAVLSDQVGHARPSGLEIRVLLADPVDLGALLRHRYRARPFDLQGIYRQNLVDPFAPSAQEDLENRGDQPLRDNHAHQAHRLFHCNRHDPEYLELRADLELPVHQRYQ